MPMTKEEIHAEINPFVAKHWARMCKIWPALLRHPMPTLIINTRTSKTAGTCANDGLIVELSLKLFQFQENKKKMVLETLAHELIHAADRFLNGCWDTEPTRRQPHGPIWKGMMIAYGLPPNTYHSLRVK